MRRREELDFGDDAGEHEEENREGRGDGECGKVIYSYCKVSLYLWRNF